MQYLILLLYLIVAPLISSCGWQLRGIITVPSEIKIMIFESYDPNNLLSRMIQNQLCIIGIKLVEKNSLYQNTPSLHILSSNLTWNTNSILQNGFAEEYQVVLSVNAMVFFSEREHYPINVKICRSFFSNPEEVLAQDFEKQIIFNEIHHKVVTEIIRKLSCIKFLKK